MTDYPLILALAGLEGLSPEKKARVALSGSAIEASGVAALKRAILEIDPLFLITTAGITKAYDRTRALCDEHLAKSVNICAIWDCDYPTLLRDIPDAPLLLYYLGDISVLNSFPCVAIVGTREPTDYGLEMSNTAGEVLARAGYTVVSGLARGCDTSAHQGSISGRGKTVAFVAHGLQTVYPPENAGLATGIVETGGCVATEYPLGSKLHPAHFKRRNRLQTGTSLVTIVIESDLKSGTMYTAGFAQLHNRKLLVLDHPSDKRSASSEGNLRLLSQGYAQALTEDQIFGLDGVIDGLVG